MILDNGMTLTQTQTIRGIHYTTVSIFNGEADLYEKLAKIIGESFAAAELSESVAENQYPAAKAG